MLLDATLTPLTARRHLIWIAAPGTTLALWASLWQLLRFKAQASHGTVETSAFYCLLPRLDLRRLVLVTLLLSLATPCPKTAHHQGEYFALMVFGAVGMCLMTSAVELLVVFIALEISSISTYILTDTASKPAVAPKPP